MWFDFALAFKNCFTVSIKNLFETPSVNFGMILDDLSATDRVNSSFKHCCLSPYRSCPYFSGNRTAFTAIADQTIDARKNFDLNLTKLIAWKFQSHLILLALIPRKSKYYLVLCLYGSTVSMSASSGYRSESIYKIWNYIVKIKVKETYLTHDPRNYQFWYEWKDLFVRCEVIQNIYHGLHTSTVHVFQN